MELAFQEANMMQQHGEKPVSLLSMTDFSVLGILCGLTLHTH
jgi:hypothetical protein